MYRNDVLQMKKEKVHLGDGVADEAKNVLN